MKAKFLSVFAALAMVFAFTLAAQAQYAVTDDVIFLKVGYIPNYTVSFNEADTPDLEFKGFGVAGEYNINFGMVWLGVGLEYQYVYDNKAFDTTDELTAQFILPQVNVKFVTAGGLYLGAGLAGKYLISNDFSNSDVDFDKKIDLWGNILLGYVMPIAEGVYFNVEGRFGYNFTNDQWKEYDSGGASNKIKMDSAYDFAIYVGIGFRALSTGL